MLVGLNERQHPRGEGGDDDGDEVGGNEYFVS